MLSPEVFTPPLLPSGPTTALWVSVLLCLLQVLNVSSFCCLVELAKLNRSREYLAWSPLKGETADASPRGSKIKAF